ncbi:NAD(P)-dependent oxidoreductase [Teredinibacter haidensis]|uniref:NAD(P)-dependent oxidoreductase n=1 Tax=Teredinibacter haidensis TaxID=2731755 RepID=UPI000948A35D|nr:NAD(P)-dependent oxidoreductase [Teredinibacter haidensis]
MTAMTFLGLGAMGSRMATHLIKAGYPVTVWNRSPAATEPLLELGALVAATPAAAAQGADIVFSMVRDDEASRFVWLDPQQGAINAMKPGTIAVECSTLTPEWVKTLASTLGDRDISLADAPVSGSRPQAEAAKLVFLVGSDRSTFEKVLPLLQTMGGTVNHVGESASGATIKLAVNALLGVQLAATAELLGFIQKSGLDLTRAMDAISSTPVCSPATKLAGEAMVAGNFAAAFPIELVAKDFGYVESAAHTVHVDVPVSASTRQVYLQAIEQGLAGDNITGIAKRYVEFANISND